MTDLMEQIETALEKGQSARANEPRAVSAHFDASRNRIVIILANDAAFEFPPDLAQGLAGATDDQLAEIEILDEGSALHWESLDADFSVANLLSGVFGTARWMASRAGSSRSPRKAAAAREPFTRRIAFTKRGYCRYCRQCAATSG
jgi:hypothetical protein